MSDDFTVVFMAWRKKRRNHRLIFGRPAKLIRLDWQRSIAVFKPGDIFAYERWEANKFGTQHWSISVLQAASNGEAVIAYPGVKPGAHILARRHGSNACRAFFILFDILRKTGEIESVGKTNWQVIGHRLNAGTRPNYILKDLGLA